MEFLKKYERLISEAISKYKFKNNPLELYEPIDYAISCGGKRLRPIMVLMANDLFGGVVENVIPVALAVEFFHNFTLIHDDIMDVAPLRRGQPTVYTKYGINTGILSGDALLIKSYQLFENLEPFLFKKCVILFSEIGMMLCEGQQMDVNFETQKNLTYQDYIQMITYKTGVLSALSFKLGALIAGAQEKQANLIYEYGKNLGIAFQIMDDYLDVFGDRTQVGKKYAGDIYENKKTILYFVARNVLTDPDREELDYWYAQKTNNVDKIYSVEKIFRKANIEHQILKIVEEYNQNALSYLSQINALEEKKEMFRSFINHLVKRKK